MDRKRAEAEIEKQNRRSELLKMNEALQEQSQMANRLDSDEKSIKHQVYGMNKLVA